MRVVTLESEIVGFVVEQAGGLALQHQLRQRARFAPQLFVDDVVGEMVEVEMAVAELVHVESMVAGGETSGTVVERLGIDRLRIGAYQGPGLARATTEEGDTIALSLKSGKLGPVGMFLPTLESMRHPEN